MKIIFFGTPEFVIPIFQALLDLRRSPVAAVVTTPDKPVGRQQILTASPVKLFAQEKKIKIIDSGSMIDIIKAIKKLAADVGVLAAYGKILPQELIDLFPKGILVFHPSLLPKFRGASPVPAAILSGEKETGVTVIKMDEKMDHGKIIYQFKETIKDDDTSQTLLLRLFEKSSEILKTVLPLYLSGKIKTQPQNDKKATFSKMMTKDDGFIPPDFFEAALRGEASGKLWSIRFMNGYSLVADPASLCRFIRAMTPWPSAWTISKIPFCSLKTIRFRQDRQERQEKRLKILRAHLENDRLVLDSVQLEGKSEVSWEEFQRGYPQASFS